MLAAFVLMFGALISLVGSGFLAATSNSALRTGAIAANSLQGGYRRDRQPFSYWYFVGLAMIGSVMFLGLSVFSVFLAAC